MKSITFKSYSNILIYSKTKKKLIYSFSANFKFSHCFTEDACGCNCEFFVCTNYTQTQLWKKIQLMLRLIKKPRFKQGPRKVTVIACKSQHTYTSRPFPIGLGIIANQHIMHINKVQFTMYRQKVRISGKKLGYR